MCAFVCWYMCVCADAFILCLPARLGRLQTTNIIYPTGLGTVHTAFFTLLYGIIYVYCMRLSSQLIPHLAAGERCSTSELTVMQRSSSSRRTDRSATTVCLTPRPHRTSVPPHWATFSSLPIRRIKKGFSVQNKQKKADWGS